MSEDTKKDAQVDEQESTSEEQTETKDVQEDTKSEEKEETVGDFVESVEDKKKEKTEDSVPLASFLDEKKGRKEAEKQLAELKSQLKDSVKGTDSNVEITGDIDSLAKEFDVDPKFLSKLANTIRSQSDAQVEERLRPLQEKEREQRFNEAFNARFDKALDNMPEFEGIANKEVIKSLVRDPNNSKKTLSQLIEETYGNAVQGKRTTESTVPRGGKGPQGLDYDRAKNDSDYFKEVMANPDLKKQYNEQMIGELG